jgi:hypothetical protein
VDTADFSTINKSFMFFDAEYQELVVVYQELGTEEPGLMLRVRLPDLSLWPQRYTAHALSAGGRFKINTPLTIGDLTAPIGEIGRTLAQMDVPLRRVLLGTVGDTRVYREVSPPGSDNIETFSETGLIQVSDPVSWKTIKEIEHFFKKVGGPQVVTVRVGVSNYGEERVLGPVVGLNLDSTDRLVTSHMIPGRFFSLRYEIQVLRDVEWQAAAAAVAQGGMA